jgi:hypothetical protein
MSEAESGIYDRWSQALASAKDLCAESLYSGQNEGNPHLSVVLPGVVVPDGTLWEARYDRDGESAAPEAVEATTVFVNHEIEVKKSNNWTNLSHVHFWTLSGLKHFLDSLRKEGAWDVWFLRHWMPHTPRLK